MNRAELKKRVEACKAEHEADREHLKTVLEKAEAFIEYIKSKPTLFAALKITKIWKDLIQIIEP